MKTTQKILSLGLASACGMLTGHAATIAEAGGGTTGTAQAIDAAQDGAGAFIHTLTGGVLGDATLIESGIVTTVINGDGNGARVTSSGTAGNTFTLSTNQGGGGAVDPSATLFTDNTFASSAGTPAVDQDDGAGAFEEYRPADGATINVAGEINIQYNEVAGADGDIAITFGYDLLDITNRTHNTDFFRLNNLLGGSTLDVEITASTSGSLFGFFDGALQFYDSSGTAIGGKVDGDAGFANMEDTSVVVPGDGIIFVEVTHSGDPAVRAGGTYGLELSGVAVPEPSSAALLGLGGLALILRRRK